MSRTPLYIAGMVVFGCLNTETTKIQFTLTSVGLDGQPKLFHKPWQAVLTMFLAMDVVLVYHAILSRRTAGMVDGQGGQGLLHEQGSVTGFRRFIYVGMPAVFDLLGTGFGMIGFVCLSASINQMLRGATIPFSAIFSVFFLKRKMFCYNWIGVGMCIVGIAMVGTSSVLAAADEAQQGGGVSFATAFFGMCMNLLGQVFAAAQICTEEIMLKSLKIPPMQVVGYEGAWGTIIMICVVFPILYALPGDDNGSLENWGDTLEMIRNNSTLFYLICLYIFSCSTYNIAGQLVTKALSAVHRTMLEASRTMFIWVINLSVHYFVDPNIGFSEAWTPYSWLQLAGFLVVICGQVVYGGLVQIPGLRYEASKTPVPSMTPSAMYNFSGVALPGGEEEETYGRGKNER